MGETTEMSKSGNHDIIMDFTEGKLQASENSTKLWKNFMFELIDLSNI